MTETISLKELSTNDKILLLRELGYDSDGTFVLETGGKKVIDKYIEQPIKIDNMLVLQGSTLIIDNNPLSIASYLEEYPDAL